MFSIIKSNLGSLDVYKLSNSKTGEYLSVIPKLGGMLHKIGILQSSGVESIIDSYNSEEELKSSYNLNFKGSKLSPYPNRIYKGTYTFNKIKHELPISPNFENFSIHGFILDKEFDVKETIEQADKTELILCYKHTTSLGFPFAFEIELKYTLTAKQIDFTTKVKNTGLNEMPYGDGWHPYFVCGNNINDLLICAPTKTHYFADNMIQNGWYEDFQNFNNETKIGDIFLDDSYELDNKNDIATIKLADPINNNKINIWVDVKSYPYIHIYTPKDRKSIAIEPMSCLANAFNNGVGLIKLKKDETKEFNWGVLLNN